MEESGFKKFPKIYGLHNVVKNHNGRKRFHPEIKDEISYFAKFKIHGTNAAIRIERNGDIIAQKRSSDITVDNDNCGFAAWVDSVKHHINTEALFLDTETAILFEGEWAGPGIQKGVAVSQLEEKTFFIFSVTTVYEDRNYRMYNTTAINDFVDYAGIRSAVSNVKVIPEYTFGLDSHISINFGDRKDLESKITMINDAVQEIEDCDPYIKELYGIEGVGEGLVFYPMVDSETIQYGNRSDYTFKVKGEKHAVNKMGKPARIASVVPSDLYDFVDRTVTEARLEQAVSETNATEKGDVGKMIGWVCKDIVTECADEIEAMGANTKMIGGPIAAKVRGWWFNKLEEF